MIEKISKEDKKTIVKEGLREQMIRQEGVKRPGGFVSLFEKHYSQILKRLRIAAPRLLSLAEFFFCFLNCTATDPPSILVKLCSQDAI